MKALTHRSAGLLTTSLLIAGVNVLSPVSVKALGADTCSFGANTEFPACSSFTFDQQFDKTLKLVKGPTVGDGTIQFVQQTPGTWVVDVDFIEDLMAPVPLTSAGFPGMLEYDLTIAPLTGNNNYFFEAGLAIIGPPVDSPAFQVTKTSTGLPRMLFADQTMANDQVPYNLVLKTIHVMDEYTVTNGSINSFQNSFTQITLDPQESVPGPLPLLGAGAAFGFSRRLRTRVLAARRG